MAEFFTAGNCVWLVPTLVWSLIYAVAVCLVNSPASGPNPPTTFFRVWWWCSQLVFNFLGAVIGWVVLYFLWQSKISEFKVEHFVALIIAYLGITGNLPQIVMRLRGPDV